MISVSGLARGLVFAMTILAVAGAVGAATHATWPTDWNNWNDPALWATVGNPGNVADTRYASPGYGAVAYTYNMGKYEVTAGQYTAFLNAVAKTDAYALYNTYMDAAVNSYGCNIKRSGSPGSYAYSVASDYANRPVNYISWGDAARFANWLTHGQPSGTQNLNTTEDGSYYLNGAISDAALLAVVRKSPAQGGRYYIPTEDEWYKAAYYGGVTGNYWDYPTGTNAVPGRDMSDLTNPGNNVNYYGTTFPIDSGTHYTTVAGEFQLSDSAYGTFDQGGNLWEWNEAVIGAYRGVRGGGFYSDNGQLNAADRASAIGDFPMGHDIGFRVSEVPEPATLALLAVGGLLALRRRR